MMQDKVHYLHTISPHAADMQPAAAGTVV